MILEKKTALPFDCYLKAHVFEACCMDSTGYYELDRLPANCANNYIFDEQAGAFTTVGDISSFWENLLSYKLLSPEMTKKMLSCHSGNETEGYYGYGIWLKKNEDQSFSPYVQGCDPGVSFISAHDFKRNITVTLVSNFCDNVWKIMQSIRKDVFVQ